MVLSDLERERYARQMLVPELGEAGQAKLLRSRVLVVGVGGLGSPALLYLTACGIGEIGMMDGDSVEVSNLQRQVLHGDSDVGRMKTASAVETLRRLRSDVQVEVYPVRISWDNASEIISRYDFVVEATDDFESKFIVNDACVLQGKAFSHAGILGTCGQTMTVVPGRSPCYRCLFEDVPPAGAVETTHERGVLGSVAGVLGAIQATEAIKYLSGMGELLLGRLLTLDALTMTFREIALPTDQPCPVCLQAREGGSFLDRRNGCVATTTETHGSVLSGLSGKGV